MEILQKLKINIYKKKITCFGFVIIRIKITITMAFTISAKISNTGFNYEQNGTWSGTIMDSKGNILISGINLEFIPGMHGDKAAHLNSMTTVISTVAITCKYRGLASLDSRVAIIYPRQSSINFSFGSTYNIKVNGVTNSYNRLRNNMEPLSYSHGGIIFDIALKSQSTITSLPRTMF